MSEYSMRIDYLSDQGIFRICAGEPGHELSKVLDASALLSLLSEVVVGQEMVNAVRVGPSPDNYLGGEVDLNVFTGILYYKVASGIRPVKYEGRSAESYSCMVNFPDMVFKVTVGNGRFTNLAIYCYEGELRADTVLYQLPMSNVYGDGRICSGHGAENFPVFQDFFGIYRVMDVFFSSVYNGDLWDELKYGCSFLEQLKMLEMEGCRFEKMHPLGKCAELCKEIM